MSAANLSTRVRASGQTITLATIALAGVVYFFGVVAMLHVLRPDLNPIRYPVSAYANGSSAFLMATAFLGMSVGAFALTIGLYQALPRSARSAIGLGLLAMWGLGVLIAMIFPMDAEDAPRTLAGVIHDVSGPLAFLSMALATNLLSWCMKHEPQWRPLYRAALTLSWVLSVGFVATLASFITGSDYLGLVQRITLLTMGAWMLLVAARLMRR